MGEVSSREELEPCPFCGGTAEGYSHGDKSWVKCTQCENSTASCWTMDIAVFNWNRRTDYKALAQVLATVLLRYEKKLRYTSDEMDMDAVDVLLKAREAGLEVP